MGAFENQALVEQASMRTRSQRLAEQLQAAAFAAGSREAAVEFVWIGDGPNRRMVSMWPRAADKHDSEMARLWNIIDGATRSVTVIASRMRADMDAALTDANLSAQGQRAQVAMKLRFHAQDLAKLGTQFLKVKADLEEKRADLAGVTPYKTSEPWRWHQDLEVVRVVRELPLEQRTALRRAIEMGEHMEVAEALVRVPVYLTGLTPDGIARITAALIDHKNPGYGARAALEGQCQAAAADAINALCKMMEAGNWIEHEDLRVLLGPDVAQAREYAGQPIVELHRELVPAPAQDGAAAAGAIA